MSTTCALNPTTDESGGAGVSDGSGSMTNGQGVAGASTASGDAPAGGAANSATPTAGKSSGRAGLGGTGGTASSGTGGAGSGGMHDSPAAGGNGVAGEGTADSSPCKDNAGAAVCEGSVMHLCDAAGASTSQLSCENEMSCQIGLANSKCASCNPGAFKCDGAMLSQCVQGEYMALKTCDSAALCKEDAGDCTPMTCQPGAKSCANNGDLKTCNSDGSGFVEGATMACGANLCDATAKRCYKCVPNSMSCTGNAASRCSTDGQTMSSTPCMPKGECSMAACGANQQCANTPKPRGTTCSGGKCDGNGTCAACIDNTDCKAEDCTNASCVGGRCSTTNKSDTSTCPDGVCDGSGRCVECNSKNSSRCTNGATCNASHQCVAKPCGNGVADPGETCETAGPYAYGPGTCDSNMCRITDSAYARCGGTSVCPPNPNTWFCSPHGACSAICDTSDQCKTTQGKGTCETVAGAKYCVVRCSSIGSSAGCPTGLTCVDTSALGLPSMCGTLAQPTM